MRKLSKAMAICGLVSALSFPHTAEAVILNYKGGDNEFALSGNAEVSRRGQIVTLSVADPYNNIIFVKQTLTDEEGGYKFTFDLSQNGDACVFNIDMTGTATMLGHVYDYETDTVLAPYSTPVTEREITMTHVYNIPDDPSFVEAYAGTTGFDVGNPTDERFVLNFIVLNDNKVVTFDRDTEDISRGRPAVMLDFQSDTSRTKYTKVLVRYYYDYPMNYIIYK